MSETPKPCLAFNNYLSHILTIAICLCLIEMISCKPYEIFHTLLTRNSDLYTLLRVKNLICSYKKIQNSNPPHICNNVKSFLNKCLLKRWLLMVPSADFHFFIITSFLSFKFYENIQNLLRKISNHLHF